MAFKKSERTALPWSPTPQVSIPEGKEMVGKRNQGNQNLNFHDFEKFSLMVIIDKCAGCWYKKLYWHMHPNFCPAQLETNRDLGYVS